MTTGKGRLQRESRDGKQRPGGGQPGALAERGREWDHEERLAHIRERAARRIRESGENQHITSRLRASERSRTRAAKRADRDDEPGERIARRDHEHHEELPIRELPGVDELLAGQDQRQQRRAQKRQSDPRATIGTWAG